MSESDNKKELPATLSGANVSEEFDRLMSSRIHPETRMQCKVCWYIYDPEEGCGHPKSAFLPADDDLG